MHHTLSLPRCSRAFVAPLLEAQLCTTCESAQATTIFCSLRVLSGEITIMRKLRLNLDVFLIPSIPAPVSATAAPVSANAAPFHETAAPFSAAAAPVSATAAADAQRLPSVQEVVRCNEANNMLLASLVSDLINSQVMTRANAAWGRLNPWVSTAASLMPYLPGGVAMMALIRSAEGAVKRHLALLQVLLSDHGVCIGEMEWPVAVKVLPIVPMSSDVGAYGYRSAEHEVCRSHRRSELLLRCAVP